MTTRMYSTDGIRKSEPPNIAYPGTFAVTGFGRSGTRFLAELLNTSPSWEVRHECPMDWSNAFRPMNDPSYISSVVQRFQVFPQYGEVNSFLRLILDQLDVDRKCVILRNPLDIVVSSMNWDIKRWASLRGCRELCEQLLDTFMCFSRYEKQKIPFVRFEELVAQQVDLVPWAQNLGITDFNDDALGCDIASNRAHEKYISSWSELPSGWRLEFQGLAPWLERWWPNALHDFTH